MIGMIIASIFSNSCYNLVVPFLPNELDRIGMDVTVIGFVFSIYAVASFTGSIVVGEMMMKVGRKRLLLTGLTTMGTAVLGFGLLSEISNLYLAIFIALILRLLQGMSSAFIQTTCYSIIWVLFPHKRESYMPIIEWSIGFGCAVGPLLGAVLYKFLGFKWTFLSVGLSFYFLFPLFYFVLSSSIDRKDTFLIKESEEQTPEALLSDVVKSEVTYLNLARSKKFMLPAIGAFLAYFLFAFSEPVLALRVAEFNLSRMSYGIFFTANSFGYILCSLFLSRILKLTSFRTVIISFSFAMAIFSILIGPSQFLPDSILIMITGQFMLGFLCLPLVVTPLLEMTDVALPRFPGQSLKVVDMCAGFFNSSLWFAQLVAPLFGSFITKHYNFRVCSDILTIWVLIYSWVYLLFSFSGEKQILLQDDKDLEHLKTPIHSLEIEE